MPDTFTPTTDAKAIPTVVAQETIKQLPAAMGIARFVSKDTDWTSNDFANYGDTLQITKPGSIVAKKKTPGTPITYQNATADKVSVTLDTHTYVALLHEDITKLLRKPDLQLAYAQRMAIVIAESIESSIFALHPSITNTVTWDRTSATTVESSFLKLRSKFSRLKVAPGERKDVFFDTSIIDDLLANTKYSSGDFVLNLPTEEGVLRRIYGFNIHESQLVPTTGSPVAYHNLALTKWGVVLVSRPMPLDGNGKGVSQYIINDPATGLAFRMTEGYDKDNMGTTMNLDVLTGAALADVNKIIEVESF